MKALLLNLILLFYVENCFAGCGGPRCQTDNGLFFGYISYGRDSAFVNESDSFTTKIYGGTCNRLMEVIIKYNGKIIHQCSDGYCTFKFQCKLGLYEVYAKNSYPLEAFWRIVLLPKIYPADTVLFHENFTGSIPNLYPQSLIYPNPAQDVITFFNETEEIKRIDFYNSLFQLYLSYEPDLLKKIAIPISNFPRGVYFVRVATLSEKIILKKVILQ